MTTISDLPRDLAEEIFSRVPLKFMRAVRLTCKKWDTLSKNRSFTKKQAAKEGNSGMIVLLMDYKLYLMSVVVNGDPYTEPKGKLACLNDSEQVEISQIFQCEGLLLCILKDTLRLAVWNPYLGGQTRWIEPRYSYLKPNELDLYRYALGYSKKSKLCFGSHKILRFIDDYFGYCPSIGRDHFSWYEIYNFDTGLWKTLDFTSPHWRISSNDRGVSLKGNTYWITTERESRKGLYDHIICFDFTRERFGRLLPLPCRVWLSELVTLSCVREEKLAALFHYDEATKVEIWMTTKIAAEEVLWSKFLAVNMETIAGIPIAFGDGSFLIDEEKKLAMVFDKETEERDKNLRHTMNIIGEDGYFKEVDLGEDGFYKLDVRRVSRKFYCWTHVCSFVPSLVQIKQGGCKRKKQSSLERHRCDQKTSRLVAIQKRMKLEYEAITKV